MLTYIWGTGARNMKIESVCAPKCVIVLTHNGIVSYARWPRSAVQSGSPKDGHRSIPICSEPVDRVTQ